MNPLKQLSMAGQSVWLDYIDHNLVRSGELQRMVSEDGLTGVTSNPVIFEKAIASGETYREDIDDVSRQKLPPIELLENLILPDIEAAADQLHSVYP